MHTAASSDTNIVTFGQGVAELCYFEKFENGCFWAGFSMANVVSNLVVYYKKRE